MEVRETVSRVTEQRGEGERRSTLVPPRSTLQVVVDAPEKDGDKEVLLPRPTPPLRIALPYSSVPHPLTLRPSTTVRAHPTPTGGKETTQSRTWSITSTPSSILRCSSTADSTTGPRWRGTRSSR